MRQLEQKSLARSCSVVNLAVMSRMLEVQISIPEIDYLWFPYRVK
jgi:hypothetical protein